MEKVNHTQIIKRYYLLLVIGCLLPVVAMVCLRSFSLQQHSLQILIEQLNTLESSLLHMEEAVKRSDLAAAGREVKILNNVFEKIEELKIFIVKGNEALTIEEEAFGLLLSNNQKLNKLLEDNQEGNISFEVEKAIKSSYKAKEKLESLSLFQAKQLNLGANISFWAGILAVSGLLLALIYCLQQKLWKPLQYLDAQTEALLNGKEWAAEYLVEGGLFKKISEKLRAHQEQNIRLSIMAEEIGEGNFQQEEDSFKGAGALGHSIGQMREKIRLSFLEEEKRRWSNEGITHFSTLVRENNANAEQLCTKIISVLVPFISANQGSLFLKEDHQDEEMLVLKAAYAWGRQKHISKSIPMGEGVVGQAALDRDMIFITDVPEDYISIGSGLGQAKPRCIIVLPLISGEQLYGVLELASFSEFQEHQISFLWKCCEILASAIAMSSGNSNTSRLLQEAKEANIQLQAREEELRQNTEELMATQEAMQRKEIELEEKLQNALQEMEGRIKEINSEKTKNGAILEGCVDGVISFNQEGKIEYFNKAAEELWEMPRQEVLGRNIRDFIPVEIREQAGELYVYYAKNGMLKMLDTRTEVPVSGRAGEEMEVLLTLARVKDEGVYTFTAFAQRVAVELF